MAPSAPAPVPVSKSGRPSKKNGRFTKRVKGASGQSRKKARGAKNAEATATKEMAKMATEPHQTIDVDEQNVREEEVTTAVAQHLQVEREALQDVIECKDTKENYFLTAEVKQELGDFFARKEEVCHCSQCKS
jgi:2-hydroxychromene-2-carboxylate isomerase